jgi:hypothetical protein
LSGGVRVTGLDELMRDLTNAPAEIRAEAMDVVRDTTEGMAAAVRTSYAAHRRTGTLLGRIKTSYPASGALIGKVLSTAPHSHLFEWGTKERQTRRGANRGRMPANSEFDDLAQTWRERMTTRLMALVANRGFLVRRT